MGEQRSPELEVELNKTRKQVIRTAEAEFTKQKRKDTLDINIKPIDLIQERALVENIALGYAAYANLTISKTEEGVERISGIFKDLPIDISFQTVEGYFKIYAGTIGGIDIDENNHFRGQDMKPVWDQLKYKIRCFTEANNRTKEYEEKDFSGLDSVIEEILS